MGWMVRKGNLMWNVENWPLFTCGLSISQREPLTCLVSTPGQQRSGTLLMKLFGSMGMGFRSIQLCSLLLPLNTGNKDSDSNDDVIDSAIYWWNGKLTATWSLLGYDNGKEILNRLPSCWSSETWIKIVAWVHRDGKLINKIFSILTSYDL